MIDRSVLMNAFVPASELDDPERFAGRSAQVRKLSDSLRTLGLTPLIYGDRGLGKSSLAAQIRLIAMGNPELLYQIGAERLALPEGSQYLTFYVTCTDATRDLAGLLQTMVNSAESVDIATGPTGRANELIDRTTRKKLTVKVFELESTKKYQNESQRLSYQDLNQEEKLVQLCELLVDTYGQPVLFVIDELDRLQSTLGLASFLKAASSEYLKFLLVGIASNVSELLSDHQSLERKLDATRIPLMSSTELIQIITKAETHLESEGVNITFAPSAKKAIARLSAGFPWFVHVLGQQCLIDADEDSRLVIDQVHVSKAVREIVDNRLAQQFSDMYQMAVRDSPAREKTLRAFAHWHDPDIPTGEVYKVLASVDVRGGSTYRGHLCLPDYGSILFVPTFQKRGLIRFRNEMFKAYVRMRPSIYMGVDTAVRQAWERHNS